jgi:STE24 endopeptidase
VDGSKRSDHSNAYLYGFWNNKRIVLFDTLLNPEKDIKEEEVLGILAHELGHWKDGHVLQRMLLLEFHLFAIFYLFGLVLNSADFYASFGFPPDTSKFIGLVLFTLVLTPLEFLMNLLVVRLTRSQEFQADAFAKKVDYSSALQTALIKIYKQNSGNMNPDSLYAALYFSHPHLTERLRALGG